MVPEDGEPAPPSAARAQLGSRGDPPASGVGPTVAVPAGMLATSSGIAATPAAESEAYAATIAPLPTAPPHPGSVAPALSSPSLREPSPPTVHVALPGEPALDQRSAALRAAARPGGAEAFDPLPIVPASHYRPEREIARG